jgi:nitroreductase
MPIIDALQWRYATKKFDTAKHLTEAQLHTALEAKN